MSAWRAALQDRSAICSRWARADSELESAMEKLTCARAKALLDYCPETGLLTRKVSLSRSVKIGDVAGYAHPTKGYVSLFVDGVRYKAHRIAWLMYFGKWPSGQIDHINGNPADNRIANLRDVSNQTNSENKIHPKAGNTSGLLGVSWMSAANKWRAQIAIKRKVTYLGLFTSKEEAHAAYLAAKRQMHPGCTI